MLLFSRLPLRGIWTAFALAGSLGILISLLSYFDSRRTATFLLEKGATADGPLWRTSFYLHITSASVCLLVGPALMFMRLIRMRRFHSFVGYIYLNTVLWIAAPTGLLISSASKGGYLAATGFWITGLLWWISTWMGYQTIRSGDRKHHAAWMIRSYSIALGAVWFRAIQLSIAGTLPIVSDRSNYIASVWLSLLVSIWISEISVGAMFRTAPKIKSFASTPSASTVGAISPDRARRISSVLSN